MGVPPEGLRLARDAEKDELDRERIGSGTSRPLQALANSSSCPGSTPRRRNPPGSVLVDLSLAALPGLDVSPICPPVSSATAPGAANAHARELRPEAETIAARQTRLTWLAPAATKTPPGACCGKKRAALWTGSADDQPPSWTPPPRCRAAANAG